MRIGFTSVDGRAGRDPKPRMPHRRLPRSSLASLAGLSLVVTLTAAATPPEPPPRHVSWPRPVPTSHVMVDAARPARFVGERFAPGARLRFMSVSLSATERLSLEGCDDANLDATATATATWRRADFERSPVQDVLVPAAGRYCLSLDDETTDGPSTPIAPAKSTFDHDDGALRFTSGAVVFVAVDGNGIAAGWPDDPARVATDPVEDAHSPLRKLDSPDILEKLQHGRRLELIVTINPGDAADAAFRESVAVAGEDLAETTRRSGQRSVAWQRFQVEPHDAKQRLLDQLRSTGVTMTRDFSVSPLMMVSVPSKDALRALQAAPAVKMLGENSRLISG